METKLPNYTLEFEEGNMRIFFFWFTNYLKQDRALRRHYKLYN